MITTTLCILTKDTEEVLLGYKKRGFGSGKFAGFGGRVEENETIEAAALRELFEECGLQCSLDNLHRAGILKFRFPKKNNWNQDVHVFLINIWQGELKESDEMKPKWFEYNIPYKQMWHDAQHWLPLILQGKYINAEFTFKDNNESVDHFRITTL